MQGGQQPQQGSSQAMNNAWIIGQSGQSLGYHQVQVQGEANPNSLGAVAVSSYGRVVADSTQPQQILGSAGSSSLKPEIKIKRKLFIAFIFLLLIYMLLTFLFFLIFFVQPMLDNINQ